MKFAGCILLALGCLLAGQRAGRAEDDIRGVEYFEKHVRPVLHGQCYKCHSSQAKRLEGGLKLDSRPLAMTGGDTGPAIVPGQPEQSLLVKAVRYDDVALQMPPTGKLPDEQIAALAKWVGMGAPWPTEAGDKASSIPAKPAFDLAGRKQAHWAWQPVRPSAPPAVVRRNWPANEIDQFILAKLESAGLPPAKQAEPRVLLRRLHFDLTGLPPAPADVQSFLADNSPAAWEQLVDRLLASPTFGEHWARHWLDLVRYAESRGHEFDYTLPNAWQYRDYVIRALNADVPYDQFVREQIAGDLLAEPRRHPTEGWNESLLGTGFWFLGEWVHSPVDLRKDETDRFDNAVDVMSKTFLGLTVACARCHDHKFDAISTKDYYALYGFLRSSYFRLAAFDVDAQNSHVALELAEAQRRHEPPLRRAMAASLTSQSERVADCLLAAREALVSATPAELGRDVKVAAEPGSPTTSKTKPNKAPQHALPRLSEAFRQRLATIAAVHGVDAELLADWVLHLATALDRPDDPLHVWAVLARDPGTADSRHWQAAVNRQLERLRQQPTTAQAKPPRVIVDYARLGPDDWIQDGATFGSRPVEPGELVVGHGQGRIDIATRAAARNDMFWDRQKPAAGVENEPTRLNAWWRAGRTLYTRNFQLTGGKLFYLVQGKGHVYAEVQSHRLNNGPLHGQLITRFDTGDTFRWVAHDLHAYPGQRLHLEFTPEQGATCSVAKIVEAEATPPNPASQPNRLIERLLASQGTTPPELAAGYQHLLLDALTRWSGEGLASSDEAAETAALVCWIYQSHLLEPSDESSKPANEAALQTWLAARRRLEGELKTEMHLAPAMLDGSPDDQHVLVRGNSSHPGELVPRRFLEAIAGAEQSPIAAGSGRLELAERLLDSGNPFTRRVIVNRLWKHLFGRGIVPSVDNFGVLGQPPTNPELLDWLAERFVRDGWSLKRTIKLLVMSRTYRMASMSADEQIDERDPKNLLWHRMPLRRLEAESIRDAILATSGGLDLKRGGPSVPIYLTPFTDGRGRPASGPLDGNRRRSIYLSIHRNFLSPMMLAFDMPIPFGTVGQRSVSNVPAQALILMNDPFVVGQARAWSERVSEQSATTSDRIRAMYLAALARFPTAVELAAAEVFLAGQAKLYANPPRSGQEDRRPWADLGHVLLNLKEFIFVE